MNPQSNSALTWIEVLICLAVIGILIALALPAVTNSCGRSNTQILSNMKLLHMATQQMAVDGITTGDKTLGFPGDTGGSFTNWAGQLVPAYLMTNDFCKLLSAAGKIVPLGKIPATMGESAVLVYAVSTNSPADAVFLTSANFTNTPTGGVPLNRSAKPFGNRFFVVFRQGGDGDILRPNQVGKTNFIGSFVPLCR